MPRFSKEQYKSGQHSLTTEQVKKLLLSFSDLHEKALIALAISTGIRRDDLVNIKKNDYNPNEGTITYYERKKKRTRTIYIPSEETKQLLNMHLNNCRKSEWLFPSPTKTGKYVNGHISSRQIYDIFNEHLDLIKAPRRPFHALRATCYKLCQKAGWPQRKACELLGDTLQVAEQHYNAPSIQEMQDEAKNKPLF